MKEVIRVDLYTSESGKPVEFTHLFDGNGGWVNSTSAPSEYNSVVYLGRCKLDGDMFACYKNGYIDILKGHLNSGKY